MSYNIESILNIEYCYTCHDIDTIAPRDAILSAVSNAAFIILHLMSYISKTCLCICVLLSISSNEVDGNICFKVLALFVSPVRISWVTPLPAKYCLIHLEQWHTPAYS